MNLTTDPWLHVLRLDGRPDTISLRDAFARGADLADLQATPTERIALMRLLLAIAHAALNGPRTLAERETLGIRLPEAALTYLDQWSARFNLFDPTFPFLQFAGLDAKEAKPVTKLDFSLATGNNPTLFDNGASTDTPRAFDPAWLARKLITFQNFSPGGLIGEAVLGNETTPGGGSSGHAPCTPGAMLHTFVQGSTLLETIVLNLIPENDGAVTSTRPMGRPVWEMPPQGFAPKALEILNATTTYLGRLTPLARAIRLLPNRSLMVLGNGLDYPAYPEISPEPGCSVEVSRKEQKSYLVAAREDRALWRELHSLSRLTRNGKSGAKALTLLPESLDCRMWSGALITDKASILNTIESAFSVPAGFREDAGYARYAAEIELAEKLDYLLSERCKAYRRLIDPAPDKFQNWAEATAARRDYWTRIEAAVPALITYAATGDQDSETLWRGTLRDALTSAFVRACPADSPRRLKAFALARPGLTAPLDKLLSPEPTHSR